MTFLNIIILIYNHKFNNSIETYDCYHLFFQGWICATLSDIRGTLIQLYGNAQLGIYWNNYKKVLIVTTLICNVFKLPLYARAIYI